MQRSAMTGLIHAVAATVEISIKIQEDSMGLDLGDFLFAIEEQFCVDLMKDEDEQTNGSLDELVSYLEKHTEKMPHSQEEADQVFQSGIMTLRTFFAKELAMDVSSLNSTTETESLFKSNAVRRRVWKKLRQEISDNIPPLVSITYRLIGGGIAFCVGVIVVFSVIFGQSETNPNPLPIAILLGAVAGFIMALALYQAGVIVLASIFSTIPTQCRTLEEIIRYVVPTQICLDPDGQIWTRESIEKAVLSITSKASGIPVEKISLSMKPLEM
ncbi:MAG: hypothetical protein FWH27_07685 [Planctomycetaceae bacterium]|nr:hypothetical protein [Planctomycetaceae bacterium]